MATKAQALAQTHRIMVDESWGGYTQGGPRLDLTPTGIYIVYGISVRIPKHDMDCSSSIALAIKVIFGYLPFTYTGNEYAGLTAHGWKAHKVDQHKCWDGYVPKAGDVVLRNSGHTAMFQSPTVISEFRINEFGKTTGGRPGDQTGRESGLTDYYRTNRWDWIFECPAGEWGVMAAPAKTEEEIVTDADIEKIADRVIAKIKAETNDPTGRGYNLNIFDHVKWIAKGVSDLNRKDDPTGRGVEMDTHDHVKWIAKKQADIKDTLDAVLAAVKPTEPEKADEPAEEKAEPETGKAE